MAHDIFFADKTNGNDANDGRDALGFNATDWDYDDLDGGHGNGNYLITASSSVFTLAMDQAPLYIDGGTGITVGLYIFTYISGTLGNLDRSAGSDTTGTLTTSDGPFQETATLFGSLDNTAGNEARLVTGADYVPTTQYSFTGPVDDGETLLIIGANAYGVVDGSLATISMGSMPSGGTGDCIHINVNDVNMELRFLRFEGDGGGESAVDTSFRVFTLSILDCEFDTLEQSAVINNGGGGSMYMRRCQIRSCKGAGIDFESTGGSAWRVYVWDTAIISGASHGVAFEATTDAGALYLDRCIIAHNGAFTTIYGINFPRTAGSVGSNLVIRNSVVDNNGGHGVNVASTGVDKLYISNSTFTSNGGYGVKLPASPDDERIWREDIHNTYNGNTSGASDGAAYVTVSRLTSDPEYVDDVEAGGLDYHLDPGSPSAGTALEVVSG